MCAANNVFLLKWNFLNSVEFTARPSWGANDLIILLQSFFLYALMYFIQPSMSHWYAVHNLTHWPLGDPPFLHHRSWILPWIKFISNEFDITLHVCVSQLPSQFWRDHRHCTINCNVIIWMWTVQVRHDVDVWKSSFRRHIWARHVM